MGRSWTFGQKLGGGFALVVLLTLVMATLSVYSLQSTVEKKDRLITATAQDLIDAEQIRAAARRKVAGVRGFLLTQKDRYLQEIARANEGLRGALERIRNRPQGDESRRLIAEIQRAAAEHQKEVDRIIALKSRGVAMETILSDFENRVIPRLDALTEPISRFVARQRDDMEQSRVEANRAASEATTVVIGVGLLVVVLAAAIAVGLGRNLTRQIGTSVQHVRSSSTELRTAASQQASASKEQATSMNEISTTIGELLTTSRQIAEGAQRVAKIAADTAEGSRQGDETVRKSRDALQSITQQVDRIVEHMLDLNKKSQRIGTVLDIINELSEQTNILAINATIEASGAGESGRRFAVVADEIRKLADRVGSSTREIRGLIDEIRGAVNATVMATETGSKTVTSGTERFAELATSFQRIGSLVETASEAAREIELSTKQQTTAVEQVNAAIADVAGATKETETSSAQTLETAGQLASLSDALARLIRAQPGEPA